MKARTKPPLRMPLWQHNRGMSAPKKIWPRISATERTSKWTGVFSIRIFSRIEADETLPESVLQEIRMSRATQARLARDTARPATGCDTDITGIQSEVLPVIGYKESYNHSSLPSRREIPATYRQKQLQSIPRTSSSRVPCGEKPIATAKNLPPVSKPSPPRKNYITRDRKWPILPTIPDVAVEPILSPRQAIDSDYIFLPAAPFTLTIPTFRHGPIRLNNADLLAGKSTAAFDNTLDWTAFQMAIIGGVGDFFGESTDYSKPSNAEFNEQDDIVDWFAGFGFEGPGALISAADAQKPEILPADPESKPSRAAFMKPTAECETRPPSPSSIRSGALPRIPDSISAGQKSIKCFQDSTQQPNGYNLTWQCNEFSNGQKSERVDASHNRASVDSIQSLPQSPMLDLVVSHDVDGNEYVVSMGFNLGHDLGDFLKWEAEHVFGGYHDPDQVL